MDFLDERNFAKAVAHAYDVPLWLVAPLHADPNPMPRFKLWHWLRP